MLYKGNDFYPKAIIHIGKGCIGIN